MSNKMWGGRFGSRPDPMMEDINASIDFDRHLYRQDIAASKAHAAMLAKKGIITAQDAKQIAHGLDTILSEIEAGKFAFKRALEDIHMNVESRLAELIGPAAGRLHTARSRNDQVATDFRLWVRDAIDGLDAALAGYQRALAEKALQHADTVMPGFTHLQTGAAGDLRPSSARLCRDGGARPRPVRRCAGAAQRKPARRRRARRHVVPDRSRHDRQGARLCAADGELARRRRRPRFRAGDAVGLRHRRRASVALRRGDRDLVVAARWLDPAVRPVHHRLLDDAAEAQSRTPPSSSAPRPAGSSAR